MLRLAIAGAAHIHMPSYVGALKERPDVRVTAVWDHDPMRAAKRAGELQTRPAADLAEALGNADAVLVCAETSRHLELVKAIARAGKPAFVEKPLGPNGSEARQMTEIIEAAGILYQTGFGKRCYPYTQFLREQIRRGAFGTLTRARVSVVHGGALGPKFDTEWRWMADPAQAGGGGFLDLGTHGLDLLIWWLGEVENVTASIGGALKRYPGCDEFGEGLLRFKNGVTATLAAGWVDVTDPYDMALWGTEGMAYVTRDDRLFFRSSKVPGADGKQPWTQLPPQAPAPFQQFLDAVNGKPHGAIISAREAAYVDTVMEALYKGAREQTWVAV